MKNFLSKVPQIWHILLLVFAFSIPFSIKLNSVLIIITSIFSLIYYLSRPDTRHTKESKYLLIFIIMYLLYFVGLLNSQNLNPAFFDFEQKLPLIVLPLTFGLGAILDKQKKDRVQMAFVAGTLIICLLNYRNGFYMVYSSSPEMTETNLLVRRPYLGMYCVFCIFFSLEFFIANQARLLKTISLLLVGFFCFFLFTLFAKMSYVALGILSFTYLSMQLFQKKKYIIAGMILTVATASLFYGALFTNRGKDITGKVFSFSEFEWTHYDPQWINSVNLRFIKWECTVKVLGENNNWLIGAGTGDAQQLLDKCYAEKLGTDSFFVTEHYNSHNQYLTTWLNLGLVGILFLLFHFGFFLRHHYITKNTLGLIFTLGIMLFCVTESIFETQKGIVFYTFFQLLLYRAKVNTATLRLSES